MVVSDNFFKEEDLERLWGRRVWRRVLFLDSLFLKWVLMGIFRYFKKVMIVLIGDNEFRWVVFGNKFRGYFKGDLWEVNVFFWRKLVVFGSGDYVYLIL